MANTIISKKGCHTIKSSNHKNDKNDQNDLFNNNYKSDHNNK